MNKPLQVRTLGLRDYRAVLDEMRAFTEARGPASPDELWLLEHRPVFTLGQAGRLEHLLRPTDIPVVRSDRGGQVTYHGPGQLVMYVLVDLKRSALGVKALVHGLEQCVIDMLAGQGLHGGRRPGAPGVYVDGRKLAALGLRVRRGRSYHGLSLNVDMDLGPFGDIDPCGYRGLEVTQLRALGSAWTVARSRAELTTRFRAAFGYQRDCASRLDPPS